MKRKRTEIGSAKGYKLDLSEVYEITYAKKTKYHNVGDKDLVSLPLAIMFINDKRILSTSEIDEAISKYGMTELLNSSKRSK